MNISSALDEHCGSRFWDYENVWNTTNPNFTVCFQQTVLIWVPCGFLWIFSALELYYLIKSTSRHIPWTILNVSKLVISSTLAALSLIEAAYSIYRKSSGESIGSAKIYSPTILFATFILVIAITILHRRHGIRTSAVMFVFWLLLSIAGAVTYRSLFLNINGVEKWPVDLFTFVIFMIYYPLVLAMLVLNCIADSPPAFTEVAEQDDNPLPESGASFFSKAMFIWFDKLPWTGFRKPLKLSDLWSLRSEMKSKNLTDSFEKCWKRQKLKQQRLPNIQKAEEVKILPVERKKSSPSLLKTLIKVFGLSALPALTLVLLAIPLEFLNPIVLSWLIKFTSSDEPSWKGFLYAVILFVAAQIRTILSTHHIYQIFMLGGKMHAAVNIAIYKKVLVLSNKARTSSTAGEIVNLMSVDAQKLVEVMLFVFTLISAPIQIGLALYFLWNILGVATFAGLAVMVLLFPINIFIFKIQATAQETQMTLKDQRVKLINEVLNGIKVLKLYAWEPSFEKQIQEVREEELKVIRTKSICNSFGTFIWICAPFAVSLASFATYVTVDSANVLDASKAFVSLAAFNIIRGPISQFPMAFSLLVNFAVSLRRINNFLAKDEMATDSVERQHSDTDAVTVQRASFAWGPDEAATLHDVDLRVRCGELVAVVGTIGSGKSTLMGSLTGETDRLSGRVNISGSVALVSQQAWLSNATVRENILFGRRHRPKFYQQCLEACALGPDLATFPGGDETEIGEKGINLSGGQKQRISLARAVYADADIYLFDDPLSAVDAHVGRHLFDQVIGPCGLLRRKTRILVTHGISYLPHVDKVVVLSDGAVAEVGTYKELLDGKGVFAEFIERHAAEETGKPENVPPDNSRVDVLRRQFSNQSNQSSDCGSPRSFLRLVSQSSLAESLPMEALAAAGKRGLATLIKEEGAQVGRVRFAMYVYYARALGIALGGGAVLSLAVSYAFVFGYNVWLSAWSGDRPLDDSARDMARRDLRLTIYGVLGLGQAVFMLTCMLVISFAALKAGRRLHGDMLSNVLRSPMSFFDTTPLGRIVNRFSRDVNVVDSQIPDHVVGMLSCMFEVITTFVVISMATPIFLTVVFPIMLLYYLVQQLYIPTSRQLKRLESNSLSPVYSHFSETIAGVSTVRAYGRQNDFVSRAQGSIDVYTTCNYLNITANRWLAIRLEFLGNLVVLFAAVFAVLNRETLDPGLVGLSVSYSMTVTIMLTWAVRLTSELENSIVAVERIKEYVTTPRESEWRVEATRPSSDWPKSGQVTFDGYATRYRDGLDLVLRGVSCSITAGEKIGIVGRTGAGKSSLTLALFRIIEARHGAIFIDGLPIAELGLHDLRSKITIIPQEAVLFAGSLHMNLDPFNDYSTEGIWSALDHAHLKDFVSGLPLGLEHEVTEGGQNLSAGQRQLVCLARALLRKTRILVLDEATASVDLQTDDLIQETIRREFADCTILTIAHRLATIMDSNRVIVLDEGVIKEFDSPNNLLRNSNSTFYSMAKEAGLA